MKALYRRSCKIWVVKWSGDNRGELRAFGRGRGPEDQLDRGVQFDNSNSPMVWTGVDWVRVPLGWYVIHTGGEYLDRARPEDVSSILDPIVRQYYDAHLASEHRLARIIGGVEKLAVDLVKSGENPVATRFIQDRIKQLLCGHSASALRHGAAEVWCSECFKRLSAQDLDNHSKEIMAHIVRWCKCNTDDCPVHDGPKSELPMPTRIEPPNNVTPLVRGDQSET